MPYMEATLITLAAGAASSRGAVSPHRSSTLTRLIDHPAQFFQGLLLDGAVVADPGVID